MLTKFLTLNVTGYPGDSPFYGRHMVSIKAKFSYINEKDQLCYDGSLHPGKSGGGVWISELIGEEERHTLVAIHTRGTSRSGIANLLTPDIVESIKEWRKILDGQK